MSANRLAGRYAKALLGLAIEQGQLDSVYKDIEGFSKALNQREFKLLIKSPIVNSDKKKSILTRIFGNGWNKITSSFVNILMRKRREFYLPEIAEEFTKQYKAHQKIATAILTTATPVDDATLQDVKNIVLKQTGMKSVELTTEVDASLIGGFVLKFGDKLYDTSIAHKLEKLSKQFDSNKYVRSF